MSSYVLKAFLKLFQAPAVVALQDGSLAMSQPGSATLQALRAVSVFADTAQFLTVVTPASALTAPIAWKVCFPLSESSNQQVFFVKSKVRVVELIVSLYDAIV